MAAAEWYKTWLTMKQEIPAHEALSIAQKMLDAAVFGLKNYPYADKYAQDILNRMGAEIVTDEPAGT